MISAEIIADSVASDVRLTTFELIFPRFILPELATHRVFSKNSSSSRAIPIKKMIQSIRDMPVMPSYWGKNKPGMVAKEEIDGWRLWVAKFLWKRAEGMAIRTALFFDMIGLHKQIANRILEPFTHMKIVLSATEFDNFFKLRIDSAAQPEILYLAQAMERAMSDNTPMLLGRWEWHLPYIIVTRNNEGTVEYTHPSTGEDMTKADAKMISASLCAQVSYRNSDDSLEKAGVMYDRLINSMPRHSSPFEHQATPITYSDVLDKAGVTHQDIHGEYWSGNFRGFIQWRHVIPTGAADWGL